ncbi:MAG: copper chaperone PCu(A)C [Rhodospirillales bacterium]|nr:copper chaperone PCu(A)C [Rhodospirillales bacterium]
MRAARRDLLLLGAAAVVAAVAPAVAQPPVVEVVHPWARASAGAGRSAAVFLTLIAHGAAQRLTGAATPLAGMAMLHESFEEGGVSRMRMQQSVPLPPGTPVVFRPGGLHIMLTGLKQPLLRGASFPLTLQFDGAPPVTVQVPVLEPGAAGPSQDAMPGMKMP